MPKMLPVVESRNAYLERFGTRDESKPLVFNPAIISCRLVSQISKSEGKAFKTFTWHMHGLWQFSRIPQHLSDKVALVCVPESCR